MVDNTASIEHRILLALGELRAKVDALGLGMSDLKAGQAALAERLARLEAESHRREGRQNLLLAVIRSPAMRWIAGGVVALWLLIKERVHL